MSLLPSGFFLLLASLLAAQTPEALVQDAISKQKSGDLA